VLIILAFNDPDAPSLGLLNAIMPVGSLVALPVCPYIADILGRRTGVMIGCVIMIIGVVLQSISINFGMFVGARFFIGFGVAIVRPRSIPEPWWMLTPDRPTVAHHCCSRSWFILSIAPSTRPFTTAHGYLLHFDYASK
jgi:MFS family permease